MPQSAKVTSIEAIDAFKASLIVYLEKAGCVLDDQGRSGSPSEQRPGHTQRADHSRTG